MVVEAQGEAREVSLTLYYRSLGDLDAANYCEELESFAEKYGFRHVVMTTSNATPLFRGLVYLGGHFGLFGYEEES